MGSTITRFDQRLRLLAKIDHADRSHFVRGFAAVEDAVLLVMGPAAVRAGGALGAERQTVALHVGRHGAGLCPGDHDRRRQRRHKSRRDDGAGNGRDRLGDIGPDHEDFPTHVLRA